MCVFSPNGPFRDPRTGFVHLFMQYRLRPHDKIGWAHFVTKDLVRWAFLGQPLQPDGATSCPDLGGCFTGSATIVGGVPSLMFPGVHTAVDPATNGTYVDMAQCLALPVNRSDPLLRECKCLPAISLAFSDMSVSSPSRCQITTTRC